VLLTDADRDTVWLHPFDERDCDLHDERPPTASSELERRPESF